jgi:hypothetical protein
VAVDVDVIVILDGDGDGDVAVNALTPPAAVLSDSRVIARVC